MLGLEEEKNTLLLCFEKIVISGFLFKEQKKEKKKNSKTDIS